MNDPTGEIAFWMSETERFQRERNELYKAWKAAQCRIEQQQKVIEAARNWRQTRSGGDWHPKGGYNELTGLFFTKKAREEALIREVDALEEGDFQ